MNELTAHIKAENAKTAAWIAEDPDNRWAGMIVEDPAHWADYGITDVAGYERHMMIETYIDLYKSVNGVKPRWVNFDEMSDEELKSSYDSLLVALDEENKRQAEREQEAVKKFEALVDVTMECGAGNRKTALRWMRDIDDEQYKFDDSYFEYCNGLPYGYLKSTA